MCKSQSPLVRGCGFRFMGPNAAKAILGAAAAGAVLLWVGAAPVRANTIALTNPGFETGSFSGWNTSGSDVTINSASVPSGGGNYNAQIANDGTQDGLSQFTSATFQAGTYTYTADVTADSAAVNAGGMAALAIGDPTQLGNGNPAADRLVFSFTPGAYSLETLTYTVPTGNSIIGQTVGIAFGSAKQGNGGNFFYDNANLDFAPVPEPSTLALLALGGLGLLARRRFAGRGRKAAGG